MPVRLRSVLLSVMVVVASEAICHEPAHSTLVEPVVVWATAIDGLVPPVSPVSSTVIIGTSMPASVPPNVQVYDPVEPVTVTLAPSIDDNARRAVCRSDVLMLYASGSVVCPS